MDGTLLVAGATALLTAAGMIESRVHRRRLARIPIRVHVNGTRGKSGVTRLIAAGLRAGGIRTFAKTTGTLARMILPDGSEEPIDRPGRANVIEQLGIIRRAVDCDVEAIVIECMAVQPNLQALCELKMIRATHGVITNARPDHLDAMGPTGKDVARALAGTVPIGGKLFTAEQKHLPVFQAAARDRGSRVKPVSRREIGRLTPSEMCRFDYIEHRENVALALRVCSDLGIPRNTALAGMYRAAPDPGVMATYALDLSDREVVFVNGFAANDSESTEHNWNLAIEHFAHMQRRTAVFNCRHDRPDRTVDLARACVRWQPADHYLLIGTGTQMFAKCAAAMGLDRQRVIAAEGTRVDQIYDKILTLAGNSALVMGMGNIGGPGLDVVQYICDRSKINRPAMVSGAA